MIDILEQIKNDIKSKCSLEKIKNEDKAILHLGICLYIRNKYLWRNEKNVENLNKFFNINSNVDDLSFMIIDYIKNNWD